MATAADTSNTEDTLDLSTRVSTPEDLAFDEEVDRALDERDRHREHVCSWEECVGNVPSERVIQLNELARAQVKLSEAEHVVKVLRGDFPEGDPMGRSSQAEPADDRAKRLYARGQQLRDAGVIGYRRALANEERCSVSNIQKYLDRAKRIQKAESQQSGRTRRG